MRTLFPFPKVRWTESRPILEGVSVHRAICVLLWALAPGAEPERVAVVAQHAAPEQVEVAAQRAAPERERVAVAAQRVAPEPERVAVAAQRVAPERERVAVQAQRVAPERARVEVQARRAAREPERGAAAARRAAQEPELVAARERQQVLDDLEPAPAVEAARLARGDSSVPAEEPVWPELASASRDLVLDSDDSVLARTAEQVGLPRKAREPAPSAGTLESGLGGLAEVPEPRRVELLAEAAESARLVKSVPGPDSSSQSDGAARGSQAHHGLPPRSSHDSWPPAGFARLARAPGADAARSAPPVQPE